MRPLDLTSRLSDDGTIAIWSLIADQGAGRLWQVPPPLGRILVLGSNRRDHRSQLGGCEHANKREEAGQVSHDFSFVEVGGTRGNGTS